MAYSKPKGDVSYYLPNRKRPIAYSTIASSDIIALLAKDYETIQDVYDHINYDEEAKQVLGIYISKGHGNQIAREWFK